MATATAPPLVSQPMPAEPDGLYEVIDGRIVEKPPMSALEHWLAARLVRSMNIFDQAGRLGTVCFEMLFPIGQARNLKRRPDVAFVSRERWPLDRRTPRIEAWDVIPDLAVEINSPSNSADEIMDKLAEYFRAGVRLVWVVFPKQSQVYVYDSPSSVRILGLSGDLDGGAVLPGFRLPLAELFGGEEEVGEDVVAPSAGA
jgi:Uma2 family endonuclease